MQNEINELRNQVRTLKRMLLGVLGLVVIVGLIAATSLQQVPDVIQAKKFQVVNDEGKATVEIRNPFEGAIVIRNQAGGKIRAVLTATEDGGLLDLRNKEGKHSALILGSQTGGGINLHGGEGLGRVIAGFSSDGSGLIQVTDKDGKSIDAMPASK